MSPAGAWLSARTLHHVDRLVVRVSGGRQTAAGLLGGLPIVMVTTTGRRSGRPRTLPLTAVPDPAGGGRFYLIASNWGGATHPAWYHNLQADPTATVAHNGAQAAYTARELVGPERDAAWARAVGLYPGYALYQRWRPERQIPVLALAPRAGDAAGGP